MSEQLIFTFPFKKSYSRQDFYVAKNNFTAFKLIESWPKTKRIKNTFAMNKRFLAEKIMTLLISLIS